MKKGFFLVVIMFFSTCLLAQPNRTVNITTVFSGVTKYSSLTSALTGATSGTTIWVAAGTYKVPQFIIPAGVTVIGGFPANAIMLTQRIYPGVATTAQLTILNGSYKHRVATVNGTLDGCVITQGYAYDSTKINPIYGAGGGVLINAGIVQNCILHDNVAGTLAPSSGTIPGTFVASIGDIYCTDGTILHPTYTLNSSGNIVATLTGGIPSGKTPQGIVFYVDTSPTTGHFLIMGKVNSTTQIWFNASPAYDFPLANITTLAGAMADFNGQSNSTSLNSQYYAWRTVYSISQWWSVNWDNNIAVPYTLNYNTPSGTSGQWYLPAGGELYQLWSVYPQMDACAGSILGWISSGQSMFPKSNYWSSSEYDANNVWGLSTYSYPWGSWGLQSTDKTTGGYTIPIASKVLSSQ